MRRNPSLMGCLALYAMLVAGCGGDDGNVMALDPDSWSGMHTDQIVQDCTETVQCKAQRGDPLIESPVDNCVQTTAAKLEADSDLQGEFVSNHARCRQFVVCQYLDCVITDATSNYGMTQQAAITHHCTAEVDCRGLSGNPVTDPSAAVANCVSINTSVVNTYGAEDRVYYEQEFAKCSGATACEFTACFPF